MKLIHEITDLDRHIENIVVPTDGSYFVVDGRSGTRPGVNHTVKAFDSRSGRTLWSHSSSSLGGSPIQLADPGGKLLFFLPRNEHFANLLEMPSGKLLDTWNWPASVNRDARLAANFGSLFRGKETVPLVKLDINSHQRSYSTPLTGSHVAWGNSDVGVIVCEIAEVQRRLAALGLGW